MSTPLRVLVLEDRPEDADLMIHALRKADFDPAWERVESEPEFLAHLVPELDLILADYTLPQFDALRALGLLKESGLDIPFVVVTGSISEEAAVSAIIQGASDYLLKGHLTRLGPAVVGVIEQKRLRDEKRRIEIALNENERLYRVLFQNAPIGLGLLDAQGRSLALNEALLVAAGYSLEETSQVRDVAALFGYSAEARRALRSIQQNKAVRQELVRLERKDGAGYDALLTVTPVVLGGRPCLQLMVEDVTERIRAEGQLRYQAALLASVNDAIVASDAQYRLTSWNPAAETMYGWGAEEVLGRDGLEIVRTEWPAVEAKEMRRRIAESGRWRGEASQQRKDGTRFPVEVSTNVLRDESGQITEYISVNRDITERKQGQQALRESEERYRKLVELSPDSIGIHCDGKVVYVNPATVKLFHARGPEDLIGLPVMELIHPDHRAIAMERVRQSYEDGLPAALLEEAIVTLDGQSVEVDISATPIVHEGKPATQIIIRDITERKKAEQALRESEERYRAVIHSASDAIISIDSAATIVGWNPGAERMFGYSEDEFLGQPLTRLLLAHYLPGYLAGMERLRTGGETQMLGRTLEAQGFRKDGQDFPLEMSLSEWQVGEAKYFTAIIRDITERKRAEEALRKRVTEMEALYQTSLEILARNDMPELLREIVERATRLTGGDRGALLLPTADGARLRVHVSHNMERDFIGTEVEMGEGAAGLAAQERRAIMIEDYGAWEGRSPKFLASGVGRILAIPMQAGERLIGVLNIADSNTGSYGEDDIRLASLFADQAAMAIESARLVNETNRRAAYLEALTSTAAALRAAVLPQEMYANVLGQVVDQLKAYGATLTLMDPESGGTEAVLAVGAWQGTTGMRLSPGKGIVGMVTSTGQPFVSDDIRGDARLARPELLQDLPAIACVPLTVEDQIIGCVMVGRREPLSAEEVRLLTGLAEIAGNAIYRARVMETLEARVRQRTQELEAANDRLQELDRMKTEFVSNVTHELRTPITNVLLYLDLARRTSSEPKRAHYFDVLKSESVRLGTLIESVLTLSRLERGMVPMDLEPHPLDALLADVLVGHQARADAKGITLDHELDASLPVAWVNRVQMHQVLTNLVGNAVAYTPSGGMVVLGTARQEVGGKEFVGAVVHNSGTLIPAEDLGHLFDRFYRGAVGRESGEPGTGLGLAISKEIVERHHGWIDVESSEEAGTTFSVWLPAAPAG